MTRNTALFLSLILLMINSPILSQTVEDTTKPKQVSDSLSYVLKWLPQDTSGIPFCRSQKQLAHTEDFNPSRWANYFPHHWVTRMPQHGQPQFVQGIGTPVWLHQITWNGINMVDPVYGYLDLNFLPIIPIKKICSPTRRMVAGAPEQPGMHLTSETLKTAQPFSQVFYQSGDNDYSDVNIIFRRGFKRRIKFQAGADFFSYAGIYSNSEIDALRLRTEIQIPTSQRSRLSYRLLTNRIEAGYPGAIAENYFVRFNRLHRKVLRQDHGLAFRYWISPSLQTHVNLQYHQDKRKYTDWSMPWHTLETLRWGSFSGKVVYAENSNLTTLSMGLEPAYGSRLNQNTIQEFPVTFALSHQRDLPDESRLTVNSGFSFHSSEWQGYWGRLDWQKPLSDKFRLNLSLHQRRAVPPLGWRKSRILPFEKQPWRIPIREPDSTFLAKSAPQKTLMTSGTRFRCSWHPNDRLRLYADLLGQRIGHLPYPTTDTTGITEFKKAAPYISAGLFLNGHYRVLNWITLTGRYQYAYLSQRESPALLEIPNHWLWFRIHARQHFFKNNLKANIFLFGEYLSERKSIGYVAETQQYDTETLRAIPLVHLRFLFKIGKVQIFVQWQNLLNQPYQYRSKKEIPSWQFHFGVKWQFWD